MLTENQRLRQSLVEHQGSLGHRPCKRVWAMGRVTQLLEITMEEWPALVSKWENQPQGFLLAQGWVTAVAA